MAGVRDLGLAVGAPDRAELAGGDAVTGVFRGAGDGRPDAGARAGAAARHARVLLEQGQRAPAAVDEDRAQRRVAGGPPPAARRRPPGARGGPPPAPAAGPPAPAP